MRDVAVIGAGMTRFGKFLGRTLKDLAGEAVRDALASAGIDKGKLEAAVVGNAVAGLMTGQEMVRGQVVLREIGIGGIPVVNTENACASSSTAFHLAWLYVASGLCDVALAVGMEKLYHEDKQRSFQAIGTAMDLECVQARDEGPGDRSLFMDMYAERAQRHMQKYGTTREQFARVAAKSHFHGSLNPRAQYRDAYTAEEILASPIVAGPLTRLMCSPIGDGAAAAVLCAAGRAPEFTSKPVFVRASVLGSGSDHGPNEPGIARRLAQLAYEKAGIGPEDLGVIELHDATAPAELILYEDLGLCPDGEGGRLIDSRATYLDGTMPVNTSGGLVSKGHPIGATGVSQVYEVFYQLGGEAGERQVHNPRAALTENGGGFIRGEAAAVAIHIFSV